MMLRMYRKERKWTVVDGGKAVVFGSSKEALRYVFSVREKRGEAK